MQTEDPRSREMSPDGPGSTHKSAVESERLLIAESRFVRPDLINVQSKTFEEIEEYYKHLSGRAKHQTSHTTQENLLGKEEQTADRVTSGNIFVKRRPSQFPVKKSTLTYRKPQKAQYPAASTPWR